jgi:hyperosmotically inducible protein
MMTARIRTVFVAGALLCGCAHSGPPEAEAGLPPASAATFQEAWDSVKSGAQATARFGGYVIDRTESGAVRAYRVSREKVGGGGEAISDAYLAGKVKSRLSQDPAVDAHGVHVDADAGVVTLRGTVASDAQAAQAVRDALETGGVYAVNSELQYPSRQAGERPSAGGTM